MSASNDKTNVQDKVHRDIPFGRPVTGQAEIDAVIKVLSGTTFVHGQMTHSFEEEFASRMGAKRAVSVSSCTAALHLSLLARNIGPGDEVIVPAMTHVATAHAAEFCGAEPVFVDVSAEDGNIPADGIAAACTPNVGAVMVVHYLGLPCEMDDINRVAEKAGAFVVEDCALAVDALYGDRKAGNFGLTGCFSFYPIKHMTTIEGGMLVTNDTAVADRVAQLRAFGYDRSLGARTKPGIYDVTALGYNYRMNEVEAAVGLAQLGRLDEFQRARARNFAALYKSLSAIDELTVFPARRGKAVSSHYCINATLPRDGSIERDDVVEHLKKNGIGSSVHYPSAVPMFTYYREKYGYRPGQFPVAEWLAAQTISLPVGPHLDEEDSAHIGECMKEAIRVARRGRRS